MNITNEKENKLLGRKEISLTADFEGVTPTKETIKGQFIKEAKTNPELTIVKDVIAGFGGKVASSTIFVYETPEEMKRVEDLTMHRKIREKLEAKQKAEQEARAAEEEKKKAEAEAKAAETAKPAQEAKEE